ncbi:hypothetical protein C0J52_05085 [Blattella germanica]|nr:hypothetical protein C0J52_05085 [Blattella germanica]
MVWFRTSTLLLLGAFASVLSSEQLATHWNAPTFMCHRYGLPFTQVSQQYNISQNTGDVFRGNKMVILYDPGEFPALLRDKNGKYHPRNGGVPQLGNLTLHLIKLRKEVDELVPDKNFNGLGVIDFEAWRPVWRQNWASLLPYREFSRYVEEQEHPWASKKEIEELATKRFETAAQSFMLSTLEMVKQMRPHGQWGYYTFPYCFNFTPKNMRPNCPEEVQHENDAIQWLFDASTALYPSLYLSKHRMTEEQHVQFMAGRLEEAKRVANKVPRLLKPPVHAYVWYKYHDSDEFLTELDFTNSLRVTRQTGGTGVVIWGSANDTNSRTRCLSLESAGQFSVYWNVPTFMCHKYGLQFSEVSEKYNIIQNEEDSFQGRKIVILYDPGEFPSLEKNFWGGVMPRNGGVPQEGDLNRHLTKLRQKVDELVPLDFDGLGVIDFEKWRPVWRQNFGALQPYKDYSIKIERQRHLFATESKLNELARQRFEKAAQKFMLESLKLVKQMRPYGKWGYYGFPFCFNYRANNNGPECSNQVKKENNGIQWLFSASTAIYPSLYLSQLKLWLWQRGKYMKGILNEAKRLSDRVSHSNKPPVYGYARYKYRDTGQFLRNIDFRSTLSAAQQTNSAGIIIWGSSKETDSKANCLDIRNYLQNVIGPAVVQTRNWTKTFLGRFFYHIIGR